MTTNTIATYWKRIGATDPGAPPITATKPKEKTTKSGTPADRVTNAPKAKETYAEAAKANKPAPAKKSDNASKNPLQLIDPTKDMFCTSAPKIINKTLLGKKIIIRWDDGRWSTAIINKWKSGSRCVLIFSDGDKREFDLDKATHTRPHAAAPAGSWTMIQKLTKTT